MVLCRVSPSYHCATIALDNWYGVILQIPYVVSLKEVECVLARQFNFSLVCSKQKVSESLYITQTKLPNLSCTKKHVTMT